MPETIEVQAFGFDELSPEAKERARDWYRECIDEHDFSCEIDEFATIAEIIGVDLDQHNVNLHGGGMRQEPNIYWSVGYCQSDYAAFEGTYDYKATAERELRKINNDDTWEPIRIARALAEIQLRNAFGIRAVMKVKRDWMSVDECFDRRNEARDLGDDGRDVEELMKDLARYLYRQLRDQSDYLYSDEAVDEAIEANDYKFDEDGRRHAYA